MNKKLVPGGSGCLEGNLKPFHHDFKSRLLGGEAGVAPGGEGWCDEFAWFVVGIGEVMVKGERSMNNKELWREQVE